MSEPVGNIPRSAGIPGNSIKAREPEKPSEPREEVNKMVTGKVVVHKANIFKRIGRSMVAEDVNNVGDFVVTDVIAPAMRNLLYDIIVMGAGRTIFGAGASRRAVGGVSRSSSGVPTSLKTAYHRVSNDPDPIQDRPSSAANRHNFSDISIDDRAEALDILEHLQARVERYGSATVSDFYSALGVTGSFTDQAYGWTDLQSAQVRQSRHGYMFDLPRPIALSKR